MIDQWLTQNADDLQVILFFSLFATFALVEGLVPRRTSASTRKNRWPVNLLLTSINIGVLTSLPVTFFAVAVWAQQAGLGLFNWISLPLAAGVVLNLLGRGFISFITHYLAHSVPALWRIHRVHHFDTEIDVSSTVRFHPLEFVVNLIIGVPIVIAFGLSPWMLLLYEILDAAVTLFSHANVRIPKQLDRWLRYVIVTPDLHRVHHSSLRLETDSNFSAVFPVWDLVFGTFRTHTRQSQENMQLGLEVRDGRERSLWWLLRSPFLNRLQPDAIMPTADRRA